MAFNVGGIRGRVLSIVRKDPGKVENTRKAMDESEAKGKGIN